MIVHGFLRPEMRVQTVPQCVIMVVISQSNSAMCLRAPRPSFRLLEISNPGQQVEGTRTELHGVSERSSTSRILFINCTGGQRKANCEVRFGVFRFIKLPHAA